MIPDCITKLAELTYLNLRGSCHIRVLPESIGDLKSLMHLDLSGCFGLIELPVSFAELKQLVHLDLSNCGVSVSEAIGGFNQLKYLNLSFQSVWSNGHERGLPEVIGNLKKLRYLNLCNFRKDIAFDNLLDSISTLSNLEHLDLSKNVDICSLPESMGNLWKLRTLDLDGCYNLRKFPNSMVNMVSLNVLKVANSASVDESVLSQLNIAPLPHFVVHVSTDKSSSNIIRLQPTNPDKLTIDSLENVVSTEEALSIKLIEKQKIVELHFQWTIDAGTRIFVDDKVLLDKLVPPSSVQRFYISGYRSASISDWLMGIGKFLPNLSELYLWNFPNCNNLPPLGQLPNLKVLNLSNMDNLEDWNTEYNSAEESANMLMFPKLEALLIDKCPKLRIKPCLPRARFLEIEDCDNVLSSWGESSSKRVASSSYPSTSLTVTKSKVPMRQWRLLHQLPPLHSLCIRNCSDLTASPEIIQQLSSLQSLSVSNLAPLPQWLGELTSLKRLKIKYCRKITSLPDSIQQLKNLKNLTIHGCSALKDWCESEENMMKLAHI